jgi:Tfp pilus assembly protein PilF
MKKKLLFVILIFLIAAGIYLVYDRRALPKIPVNSQEPPAPDPDSYDIKTLKKIDSWMAQWEHSPKQETIEKYQSEIEKNPKLADSHFRLGQIFLCFPDKHDQAKFYFQRTLELEPDHPQKEIIHYWFGLHQKQQEQAAVMEEIINQQGCVERNPNNPQEYRKLAAIHTKHHMPASARMYYVKAIELKPNDTDLLFEAGMSLKSDYPQEALTYFRKILQLQPEYPQKAEIERTIESMTAK